MALSSPSPHGIRDTHLEWASEIPKLGVWQCLDLIFVSFTILNRLTHRRRKNDSTHLAASQIHQEELDSTHYSPSKGHSAAWAAFTCFEMVWFLSLFLSRDHPLCAVTPVLSQPYRGRTRQKDCCILTPGNPKKRRGGLWPVGPRAAETPGWVCRHQLLSIQLCYWIEFLPKSAHTVPVGKGSVWWIAPSSGKGL